MLICAARTSAYTAYVARARLGERARVRLPCCRLHADLRRILLDECRPGLQVRMVVCHHTCSASNASCRPAPQGQHTCRHFTCAHGIKFDASTHHSETTNGHVQVFECNLLLYSVHPDVAVLLDDMKRHPALRSAAFEDRLDDTGNCRLGQAAWSIACDAYCSRACLMEAPPIIALACVLLAAKENEVRFQHACIACALCSRRLRRKQQAATTLSSCQARQDAYAHACIANQSQADSLPKLHNVPSASLKRGTVHTCSGLTYLQKDSLESRVIHYDTR
jgi:hypothetical protein